MLTFENSAINHESNSEFMMVPIEKSPLTTQASKLQNLYNESISTDPDESYTGCDFRNSLKFAATKCDCRPDHLGGCGIAGVVCLGPGAGLWAWTGYPGCVIAGKVLVGTSVSLMGLSVCCFGAGKCIEHFT